MSARATLACELADRSSVLARDAHPRPRFARAPLPGMLAHSVRCACGWGPIEAHCPANTNGTFTGVLPPEGGNFHPFICPAMHDERPG